MSALIELINLIPKEKQNEAVNLLNEVKKFHQEKERMTKHIQRELVERVVLTASVVWNIPVSRVYSKTRKQEYVWARFFVYSYLVRRMQMTKVRVAELFKQNHATVVSGLNTFDNLNNYDVEFKSNYKKFIQILESNDKPSSNVSQSASDTSATATDVLIHRTIDN